MNSYKIIYICGIIGAGKSTLVNKFIKNNNYYCVLEPLEQMLSLLSDPTDKNILKLQNIMLIHHNNILNKFESIKKHFIIEGSPQDNIIFAKLSNMTNNELKIYERKYNKIINKQNKHNYYRIYLNTDINIALNRIKDRGRECEKYITIERLNNIKNMQISLPYNYKLTNNTYKSIKRNIKVIKSIF